MLAACTLFKMFLVLILQVNDEGQVLLERFCRRGTVPVTEGDHGIQSPESKRLWGCLWRLSWRRCGPSWQTRWLWDAAIRYIITYITRIILIYLYVYIARHLSTRNLYE